MTTMMSRRLSYIAMAAAVVLAGCASTQEVEVYEPTARHFIRTDAQEHAREQFLVYDPAENVNRRVYKFNAKFDKYVFLPAVDAYNFVVPEYVDDRVSSFFSNISEFRNTTNSVLQGRPVQALNAVGRFTVNTTVGLLGFYDPATHIGLKEHKADFGQTLYKWGSDTGAYVMLPVFGPTNVRDTAGMVVDALMFSFVVPNDVENTVAYNAVQYGLRPVNTRANTDFRYHGTGSPFEYELVRFVTTQGRQLSVEK